MRIELRLFWRQQPPSCYSIPRGPRSVIQNSQLKALFGQASEQLAQNIDKTQTHVQAPLLLGQGPESKSGRQALASQIPTDTGPCNGAQKWVVECPAGTQLLVG